MLRPPTLITGVLRPAARALSRLRFHAEPSRHSRESSPQELRDKGNSRPEPRQGARVQIENDRRGPVSGAALGLRQLPGLLAQPGTQRSDPAEAGRPQAPDPRALRFPGKRRQPKTRRRSPGSSPCAALSPRACAKNAGSRMLWPPRRASEPPMNTTSPARTGCPTPRWNRADRTPGSRKCGVPEPSFVRRAKGIPLARNLAAAASNRSGLRGARIRSSRG